MARTADSEHSATATVGRHYVGPLGERYYEWQRKLGREGALLNVPFFAPHVGAEDRVIDFGCGGGFLLEALEAREKTGIDPSEAARQEAALRGMRVVASPDALPAGSADVVISNHALEHTLRPLDELIALRRLLRPGGRLFLMLPVDDWRTQRHADPDDVNHHLYTWTPVLLSNLIEEAGYASIRTEIVTHGWPPQATRLRQSLGKHGYEALAHGWAVLRRLRQVRASACRPA